MAKRVRGEEAKIGPKTELMDGWDLPSIPFLHPAKWLCGTQIFITFLCGELCVAGSPRAVVFKFEHASQSPEGLVKTQIAAAQLPYFLLSDSLPLGWVPSNCSSSSQMFGDAACSRTTLLKVWEGLDWRTKGFGEILGVLWRQNSGLFLSYLIRLPWKCLPPSHSILLPV